MNPAVNAQINKGEILQAGEHGKETNFTQTQEIGGARQQKEEEKSGILR